jgi:hypothetical protein
MVDLEKSLAFGGPAMVGTHCRQSDANSSQTLPLPSGNGMFREPVPLKDEVDITPESPMHSSAELQGMRTRRLHL